MKIALSILMVSLCSCAGVRSRYHRVSSGETIPQIASVYKVPMVELQKNNSQTLSRNVHPGAKLYIPFEKQPGWNDEEEDVAVQAVPAMHSPSRSISSVRFNWPVYGYMSSGFGRRHRRMHEGIDIVADEGTDVVASRSGHVIYAGNRIPGYGNMVILRHTDTFSTVYAHLSRLNVKKGQFVSRKLSIGKVGHTGHATSSHLHFEIRNRRVPVNPLLYLQGRLAANILGRY